MAAWSAIDGKPILVNSIGDRWCWFPLDRVASMVVILASMTIIRSSYVLLVKWLGQIEKLGDDGVDLRGGSLRQGRWWFLSEWWIRKCGLRRM